MPCCRLTIRGIVQGVGFRPFVYRTAVSLGLGGWVANTGSGVEIEAHGTEEQLENFQSAFANPPPLAVINSIEVTNCSQSSCDATSFTIQKSEEAGADPGPLPPDAEICPACLTELFHPGDRRYLYPFTNCTDCGPRYTVIENIPYDRPYTTMQEFPLCKKCEAEYTDPLDRRFHAQTNCCPDCGPHYTLYDNHGKRLASAGEDAAAIAETAKLLAQGAIVAIKGIGGFHLAADGAKQTSVAALRQRKHRPDKPLAVMVADLAGAEVLGHIHSPDRHWLTSAQKPIVLVEKKTPFPLAPAVAPDTVFIGVMLPYAPVHYLLFHYHPFQALVMTSGNMAGSPIIRDEEKALQKLASVADYFLIHNRKIIISNDDSVLRAEEKQTTMLRRSRSFVPAGLSLKVDAGKTLAFGAMLKNVVCLTRGREAFLSHHIGDLENIDTIDYQRFSIEHCISSLRIKPNLVVHDLHPDYPSTVAAKKYAAAKKLPCIGVQHHHAHAVSCMLENNLQGPSLALCLDGTGWGEDASVWGGELLLAELHQYQRLVRLCPIPMPGGDKVIHEPWRMTLSWLNTAFDQLPDLSLLHDYHNEIPILLQMMQKGLNSPLTSSSGRLFDAAAALLGTCITASYEGQAAVTIEMVADPAEESTYDLNLADQTEFSTEPVALDTLPIIRGMVTDLAQGVSAPVIAAKFQNSLASLFSHSIKSCAKTSGIKEVVLSGGVFHNLLFTKKLVSRLDKLGLTAYTHAKIPPGDGGLALGQAVAGRMMFRQFAHKQ